MTKRELQKLCNEGDLSPSQVTEFYKSVRAFYVRALEYALDNLPLKDEVLKNARLNQEIMHHFPKLNTLVSYVHETFFELF